MGLDASITMKNTRLKSACLRLAAGCAAILACTAAPAAVPTSTQKPAGVHAWGYEGELGPHHWGELDAANITCRIGHHQSPIAIAPQAQAPHHVQAAEFHYGTVPMRLVNNGHTVEAELTQPEKAPWIAIDGKRFSLAQLHFHHPSEHTLAGKRYPMEMHLVHKSEDGKLAVVAAFIREGAASQPLGQAFAHLPTAAAAHEAAPIAIDLSKLLPGRHDAWMYEGSLTTPPCTEGVQWIVLKKPISLSAAQIRHFSSLFPDNHRPVQSLGDRQLED